MNGSLLKGKQISLLPLRLQKHKKYDLKKCIPPIRWGQLDLILTIFVFMGVCVEGILIKIDIYLVGF